MSRPVVRPAAAAVFGLNVVLAVASVPLSAGLEPVYDTVLYPVNGVALGLAGFLILSRLPGHAMGRLLVGLGLLATVTEVLEGYGYHAGFPAVVTVEWASAWSSVLGASGTSLILLLFPTGQVLTRRWRPLLWLSVLAVAMVGAGTAFSHLSDGRFATGLNPYATGGPVADAVFGVGQALWLVSLLGGVAALLLRYRRADGVERQQLKWLAYVVCLLAVVGSVAIFAYFDSTAVQVAIALVVPLVPAAVGVAVLRYRLYDIDLLINRTVVYGLLTLVLAGAYALTALILGTALGGGSPWTTAGATLAAAGVFLPLRRRVQDAVDRRFRRARFDALARTDLFLEELRAGRVSADGLTDLLREVLSAPRLELHYVAPGADPAAVTTPKDHVRTTVRRDGVPLAVVARPEPDPATVGAAPDLVDAVLDRAGLAIEIGRLQAEVSHRLAEVEESRARIVAAGHEERRRLERDLHDGAQQRLVSVGLALRHAQHRLGGSPVGETLETAVDQIGLAIRDLRELANGVRPHLLDSGLDAALRELARRTPLPVQVRGTATRFPSDVEATAYFVACEALANAVKHARASTVDVDTERQADCLVLTVRDDGVGGADASRGSGLRGLLDRVAAQGGLIELDSPAGSGTTLRVRLPCAS